MCMYVMLHSTVLYCRGAEEHCNAAPEWGKRRKGIEREKRGGRRCTHARDAG